MLSMFLSGHVYFPITNPLIETLVSKLILNCQIISAVGLCQQQTYLHTFSISDDY